MMFNEVPFLERFETATDAGFGAVEFLFPYGHPPGDVARRLRDNGLELALFNLPPGDWAGGGRGIAALPGREAEFDANLERALPYATRTGMLGFERRAEAVGTLAVASENH